MSNPDPFASYGETIRAPHSPKPIKPVTALEKKLEEKQRLTRAYRTLKAKENREIMAREPRLGAFARFVRGASSDEIVEGVRESWLPTAPDPVRFMALKIVNARCDKTDRAQGFQPLDDPLPPATSCFFRTKHALGVR